MSDLQQQIAEIQQRNQRVEADKAWETSWVRRGFIAVATYVFALVWMLIIKNDQPFLTAFIPAVGYVLSTISLTSIKRKWMKSRKI
jgi:hypothetical protein